MLLSGEEIKKNLGKDIIIEPFRPSQLNPNSYNLRLSNELLVYDTDTLDMKAKNPVKHLTIPESGPPAWGRIDPSWCTPPCGPDRACWPPAAVRFRGWSGA